MTAPVTRRHYEHKARMRPGSSAEFYAQRVSKIEQLNLLRWILICTKGGGGGGKPRPALNAYQAYGTRSNTALCATLVFKDGVVLLGRRKCKCLCAGCTHRWRNTSSRHFGALHSPVNAATTQLSPSVYFCRLFYDAAWNSGMHDEFKRIWKEAVVA
jgi:hypothetical protein